MTLKQLLVHKTELKHNINQRLGIVFEPFSWMRLPGAVDEQLFILYGDTINKLETLGKSVCPILDKEWYNKNGDPEIQIKSFLSNAIRFNKSVIPLIKETASFFKNDLKTCIYLFNQDNPLGFRAIQSIDTAIEVSDPLIKDLETMAKRTTSKATPKPSKVNLLTVLERTLDCIPMADVQYVNAYMFSKIEVCLPETVFTNAVLNNIKENISKHAFSTKNTLKRFVFDNLVVVSFQETDKSIVVSIANNGNPFNGDVKDLFKAGYCAGENAHSGYGLHSARDAMRSFGGDLSVSTSTGQFVFTYIITLKKLEI